MTRRSLFSALVLAAAVSASAEPVHLSLLFRGERTKEPIHLTIAAAAGDSPAAVVDRVVAADVATIDVDLPNGEWRVAAAGDSYWQPPQIISTRSERRDFIVPLWRAATLKAEVTVHGGTQPDRVMIQFVPPGEEQWVTLTALLKEKRFSCALPAGTLDLRVRARGFIPRNYPDRELAPAAATDLGAITLERGASVSGTVVIGRGVGAKLSNVKVTAAPEASAPTAAAATLFARPNAKGFFQIDGIPPGHFVLRAEAPHGFASRQMTIDVRPEMEAQIRDRLVVERPKTLTVSLDPPVDPTGHRWHVHLYAVTSRHDIETLTEGSASVSGEWAAEQLTSGKYQLDIGPAAGGKWDQRDLDLEGDEHLTIPMAPRVVRGVVRLGEKPLAATLYFGDEFSPVAVARSDEEGKFSIELPAGHASKWDIDLVAEAPPVRRHLHDIHVDGEVKIDLPLTILSGDVADQSGARVPDVLINLSFDDDDAVIQQSNEKDGTFALHGLSPGRYRVEASGFMVKSDILRVTIPEDGAPDPLHIVVKPVTTLTGVVRSSIGLVVGASVNALPTDVPVIFGAHGTSNERGEFNMILPPGCREIDVTVEAPGFSFRAFHAVLRERKMTIVVDQEGGSLSAHWKEVEGMQPFFLHGGALLDPDTFEMNWSGHVDEGDHGGTLSVSQIEPGPYTLCMLTTAEFQSIRAHLGGPPGDGRCATAYVPPFGSATVEVTKKLSDAVRLAGR